MDLLTLEIEAVELGHRGTDQGTVDHGTHARVRILVNGRDLRSVVCELEATTAATSGSAGPAGAYQYLSGYRFPTGLFEGRPQDADLLREDRVALMGCDCGDVGCWPFLASITQETDVVQWSEFRQPFRPGWTYDGLGSPRFDAEDYFREVAHAQTRFREVARLPDELVAAGAASVRAQIERNIEGTEGLLCGWYRRSELLRVSAEDLALIRSDRIALEAAIDEVMRRLAVTRRQGMMIARRDIHAMKPSEVDAREAFLAEMRALLHAPDSAIHDGYNDAVKRLNASQN
jgi:hypothetical protein